MCWPIGNYDFQNKSLPLITKNSSNIHKLSFIIIYSNESQYMRGDILIQQLN